jgi:hypothetical protein
MKTIIFILKQFLVMRQLGLGSRFGGISDLFTKIIGLFGASEIDDWAS